MQNCHSRSCHYLNDGPQLVILRCSNSDDFFLEKVIFPWQEWCFESPPDSRVEIWSYGQAGVELLHTLNARELLVSGPGDLGWRLEPQGPVRSGLPGRGLPDGFVGSPFTEVAVPC